MHHFQLVNAIMVDLLARIVTMMGNASAEKTLVDRNVTGV